MNKVTIIIPVYNVYKYFDKCINSVINQTYKNLEIILVDDGSTDGSSDKCDYYATGDNRIIVIHKRNGGLSSARNRALDIATGEFVLFLDSDDWIELNTIDLLLNICIDTNCDMAICDMFIFYDKDNILVKHSQYIEMTNWEAMKLHLNKSYICNNSVCNKLIRRSCMNMRFVENMYFEDTQFMHYLLKNCSLVINTGIPLYYHNQHEGSITHKNVRPESFDLIKAYAEKLEFVKEYYPDLSIFASAKLVRACLDFINNVLFAKCRDLEMMRLKEKAYKIIKTEKLFITDRGSVHNRKSIMQQLLIKISPYLYEKVYYLKK